jgi:hypothetical protein
LEQIMLRDDEINTLLRSTRSDHFAAGFSSRVLRRTEGLSRRSMSTVLQRYFIWMLPAAVTAIAVLAIHNARVSGSTHKGIDRFLALPSVTLDAAYTFDAGSSAP